MIREAKLKAVVDLTKRIDETNVIGILEMHKLPSKQYQEIHKQIRDDVKVEMIEKSILLRALEKSGKENVKELASKIPHQPAVIFTNMDPFKFYITASKLKSPNYAKGGDIAEGEIEVNAGPTDLMPGPVISEFSKVGIPAGVENGKIAIKRGKIVAREGDVISGDLASVLRKLKIQPIKVGLNIVAVYDKGIIYLQDVLSLAGQGYIDQTLQAHQNAINLTVAVGYIMKENVGILLGKANREAQALEKLMKLPEPSQEKKEEPKLEGKKEEAQPEKKEDVKEEKTETKSEEKESQENQGGKS